MANVMITYNGVTVTLDPASKWEGRSRRRADSHVADAGITETVRLGIWDEVFVEVLFTSRTVYQDLLGWWAWASQGKQYAIQLNSAQSVNTTLSGSESVGSTSIGVVSGTGILGTTPVTWPYLMRSADLTKFEIVNSQGYNAGNVILSAGTKYAYAAGDIFRDPDYYPKAVTVDDDFPCKENAGLTFTFSHRFREDRG